MWNISFHGHVRNQFERDLWMERHFYWTIIHTICYCWSYFGLCEGWTIGRYAMTHAHILYGPHESQDTVLFWSYLERQQNLFGGIHTIVRSLVLFLWVFWQRIARELPLFLILFFRFLCFSLGFLWFLHIHHSCFFVGRGKRCKTLSPKNFFESQKGLRRLYLVREEEKNKDATQLVHPKKHAPKQRIFLVTTHTHHHHQPQKSKIHQNTHRHNSSRKTSIQSIQCIK